MILRAIVTGGLLVILGAAVADVPPDLAPGVATTAGLALLVLAFGHRLYRRGP